LKDPGAAAAAEQAYKLGPDDRSVWDTLGWELANNRQGARGSKLIEQALDKLPDSLELRWRYVKALVASGETALAHQDLDRLLSRRENFPQAEETRKLMESMNL
jgi:predicted Zn-dependent protease